MTIEAIGTTGAPELPPVELAAAALLEGGMGFVEARAVFEAALLAAALAQTGGAVARAAELLKFSERALRRNMRERGVRKETFRRKRPRIRPPVPRTGKTLTEEQRAAVITDFAVTGAIKATAHNTKTPPDTVSWVLDAAGVRPRRRRRGTQ